MPQKYDGPDALAGATGAGNRIAERQSVSNSTTPRTAPELRRLQRQRAVERVHRLGARVVFELLDEIDRHHALGDDLDRRLAAYAERLNPDLLQVIGGDRFPPAPLRVIGAGR